MAAPKPFGLESYQFSLQGVETQGCKGTPSGRFLPTATDGKRVGIAFSGWYNHESMDKPGYYQALSFVQFRYVINVFKSLINAPGEEMLIDQLALKYFKDGGFKHSGTSVGMVRDADGRFFFAFKNKEIPTIKFYLDLPGEAEHLDKDRSPVEVRQGAKLAALTWINHWEYMVNEAITLASNAGYVGAKSGGSYNGGSNGGSNNTPAPDTTPAGTDFDNDIPF